MSATRSGQRAENDVNPQRVSHAPDCFLVASARVRAGRRRDKARRWRAGQKEYREQLAGRSHMTRGCRYIARGMARSQRVLMERETSTSSARCACTSPTRSLRKHMDVLTRLAGSAGRAMRRTGRRRCGNSCALESYHVHTSKVRRFGMARGVELWSCSEWPRGHCSSAPTWIHAS